MPVPAVWPQATADDSIGPRKSRIGLTTGVYSDGFVGRLKSQRIPAPVFAGSIYSDMKNLWQSVCKLHARFVAVASYLQSPFLLLFVRVYWGWEFAEDGWGKIHNLGKVTDYFASLNLPMPGQTALFVSVVELVGGVLLILGLLSRLTGLVLTVNMIVAFLSVEGDRAALFSVFTDPDKFSAATPYGFLFASLVILIFGPGKFSLDWLIARKVRASQAM